MVSNILKKAWIYAAVITMLAVVQSWYTAQAGETSQGSPLKVALLPIIDALPYYVAEEHGYFEKEDVEVKAVPVASALDRDQLMQAGAIDGMLNEMASTAMFNRESVKIKIVGSCRAAQKGFPLFRVLAAPGAQLKSVADLAGVPVGVSKNTIIEYVTDRLLKGQGLTDGQIVKRSVPAIPERFQLLMNGRLKAATLPDPLAQSAMESGARLIIDDTANPHISVSVLSFSMTAIEGKQDAVGSFLKAWYRAAETINANPEAARQLLLQKIRVPKNVQVSYAIPPFQTRQVPDRKQWQDVMSWMTLNGLLAAPLEYSGSVTAAIQ